MADEPFFTPVQAFTAIFVLTLAMLNAGCGRETSTPEEWPVAGKIVGPSKDGDDVGTAKKSRDVSGIACDRASGFPRRCLVIDDEGQAAQAVTVEDGRLVVGAVLPLIDNQFEGRRLELDGEAVAFSDGAFYVIGSHGHPRDRKHRLDPRADAAEIAAKIKANSQIVRLRPAASAWSDEHRALEADVERSDRIGEAIRGSKELAEFADQRLDNGGLTIEGLAAANGRLYIGFRSPVLNGRSALIMEVDAGAVFGRGMLDAKITRLDLAGRGVRDLATTRDGFVVLAGPALEDDGGFAVYRWDGRGSAKLVSELPPFEEGDKPEAILSLTDSGTSMRVLVLSDGAKEGAPRSLMLDH